MDLPMNNIFLNHDPLLYDKAPQLEYTQQFPIEYYRHQMMSSIPAQKDWIEDLNQELKSLDPRTLETLNQNTTFMQLNQELQSTIQDEMLGLIKNKLNNNPLVATNIKKQIQVIKDVTNDAKEQERQSMYELNDYMQNYSHLSFDEYKRLKSGSEIQVENKSKKK